MQIWFYCLKYRFKYSHKEEKLNLDEEYELDVIRVVPLEVEYNFNIIQQSGYSISCVDRGFNIPV